MQQSYFNTLAGPSEESFADRGSLFLAHAFAMQTSADFKDKLTALKKQHPKAAHHCFAYRLGTASHQFRVSDNGEPAGSAGRPILAQIDSRMLTDVGVVVVRYFGGILLGIPGLINAYKTATALALQTATVVSKPIEMLYRLECSYPLLNEVINLLKAGNCKIHAIDQGLFCTIACGVPKSQEAAIVQKLAQLYGLTILPQVTPGG
jgi:uncharacterized YigZ family protein